MKPVLKERRIVQTCLRWAVTITIGWVGCLPPHTGAQLAITEVMTTAATNCAAGRVIGHPDFWELTNYGNDPVDLTGYRFWDADPIQFVNANELSSTTIAAGESIIFLRGGSASVPDAAAFRAWWWGDLAPSPDVRIFVYPNNSSMPGFNDGGDSVLLWDAQMNLVDRIDFGEAQLFKGITFFADPSGGPLGVPSEMGVCLAFRAASCDDIGSPGSAACGPVPLFITEQPLNQANDAGADVTFRVRAGGLPRPRGYQWYFNGTPISSIAPAPESSPLLVNFAGCGLGWQAVPSPADLTIRNVQSADTGEYFVVFTNGLEKMTSAVVTLTVNTNPTPPRIECPQDVLWFPTVDGRHETNLILSVWQTATFDVLVRAYPPPTFRWSWSADGIAFMNIPGATNRSLTIDFVQPSHAGIYRVRVQNERGTNDAFVRLTVAPTPRLKITEAMGFPCDPGRNDWWELTNTGNEPVNLAGYRWNDSPGNIGGGPTITNAVIIQPGESIIFMESQTPESFRQWWGADNLPSNPRFIVYAANGLTETGDEINIWNHSAVDKSDFIDSVVFSGFSNGASFWFDTEACVASEFGIVSTSGVCGAFLATNGCDTGSPGWTRWTPPSFSSIRRDGGTIHLEWKAQPGSANLVQHTSRLAGAATVWTDLGTYTFAGATGRTTDTGIASQQQRFYRLVRVSAADCPCPEIQ